MAFLLAGSAFAVTIVARDSIVSLTPGDWDAESVRR
jgi:hypothetical protein